jgi:hypothetical protein
MRSDDLPNDSFLQRDQSKRAEDALLARLEKRRRYNRLFVQRWRVDPADAEHEREKRQQCHYDRKVREARGKIPEFTNDPRESICGFCHVRPSITEVLRLRVCEEARGGYLEIRILSCGEC